MRFASGSLPYSFLNIEPLTGSNYKKWREEIEIYLSMYHLDWPLYKRQHAALTATSTEKEREYFEEWHRQNRVAKNIMKKTMSDTIRGSIEEPPLATAFITAIGERFQESEKAQTTTLLNKLLSTKYTGSGSIREHILKLVDYAAKLKALKIPVSDDMIIHHALNSLPDSFEHLNTTYLAQKDKWTLNELISVCVQVEDRLKKEKTDKGAVVNLVGKSKWKGKFKGKKFNPKAALAPASASKIHKPYEMKCYFCRKPGHIKKDCTGFKAWLVKKGNCDLIPSFSIEINLIDHAPHSWWIDSGSPLHITNSLQGYIRKRAPRSEEQNLCVGNGMRVAVKAVGSVRLDLGSGNFLILDNVFYVPSMRRNLISVGLLVNSGCSFLIDNNGIKVSRNSSLIASGAIVNEYLQLHCSVPKEILSIENNVNGTENFNSILGVKRSNFNEKSAALWHRRLGHISKERLQILVKSNILPELSFDDLGDCVECIKGKMTNTRKKNSTRSLELLELIHTDICGPFRIQTICGNCYFITFIDDFSRYCHIYLISEKSQALETFKIFHTEVEKQLGKQIKVVRSDRGGEFYGKYTEAGQNKGPFALYLEQHGIKAQYTTPGTPEQNGVAERKNRTLMNMVRSMMCTSGLPRFLWGEALITANYLCNRVPSKAVSKTPFELWYGRKPSLHHVHVWGCKAEAKVYNPQIQKLDPKTVSAYFIGYPEKSKGYRFYSPHHITRIIETNKARFLDEVCPNSELENLESEFEEVASTETMNPVQTLPLASVLPTIESLPLQTQPPQIEIADPAPQINIAEPNLTEPEPLPPQNENHNQPQPLRRSVRTRRPTIDQNDYVVYLQEPDFDFGEDDDPVSYKQAVESEFSEQWKLAMEAEIASMFDNGVWELVEPVENYKPVGCKWVYKTKRHADGSIERHKARLVAKGFTQKEGIDFTETFSPVSTKDAFRMVMAMVAHFDMELHQMDVKTAFLNGELEENIYMRQPEGFIEQGSEHLVCKLKKSIYGLKQASRQWYKKFDSVITSFGFTENLVDECVYMKSVGRHFIFLILYVDDILLASSDLNLLNVTKAFLSKNFDMKDLGEASFVLGIEIKRDRKKGLLGLSQQSYINKVLTRFDMQKCAPGEVPVSKGDKLHKGQCPRTDLERENMKTRPYARLVGSLMYAQVCTRPDLAFAVGILARFQSDPGQEHWVAGKKVLRYLQRTKNHMLVYRRVKNLDVIGYTDSDFAGHYPENTKSTSGYVYMMAGGAIAWRSVKQTLTATSTMQAEFIAIYEGVCQGLWLRNFLIQTKLLDSINSKPLKVYCDNSAAVCFTKNNKRSTNSKHIDLKYYNVRERVKHNEIEVAHIDTLSQLADPFTKALSVIAFQKHVADMGIRPTLDA